MQAAALCQQVVVVKVCFFFTMNGAVEPLIAELSLYFVLYQLVLCEGVTWLMFLPAAESWQLAVMSYVSNMAKKEEKMMTS